MNSYVLGFQEIDKTKLIMVGGKGANLGNCQRLKEYRCRKVFVLLLRHIKE
ncbi:MAG: hypothetical protein ACM3TR_06800 [Caulobacteraceae bacterium]